MTWTPVSPLRSDLVYESSPVLSGTSFVGPWFETTRIYRIGIAAFFESAGSADIWVFDGQNIGGDSPQVLRTQSLTTADGYIYGELDITARYFNFQLGSSTSDDTCVMTIRSVRK